MDEATLEVAVLRTAVADRGGGDPIAFPQKASPRSPAEERPVSDHPSLSDLDAALPFVDRHIGLRPGDIDAMLERLGFASLDALMDAAVPGGIRATAELDLPAPLTEEATARELRALAAANHPGESMIGLGYHGTITPPVIRRNVLEDPSWYTAYTPYQPEISQGRSRPCSTSRP